MRLTSQLTNTYHRLVQENQPPNNAKSLCWDIWNLLVNSASVTLSAGVGVIVTFSINEKLRRLEHKLRFLFAYVRNTLGQARSTLKRLLFPKLGVLTEVVTVKIDK